MIVNHREELILEITRIKRGDFSNERIENGSLKLCINVQNEQIEKLTAERDALKQQRDELVTALEKLTDVFANIGITSGLYNDEQDALKEACDAIASVKGGSA